MRLVSLLCLTTLGLSLALTPAIASDNNKQVKKTAKKTKKSVKQAIEADKKKQKRIAKKKAEAAKRAKKQAQKKAEEARRKARKAAARAQKAKREALKNKPRTLAPPAKDGQLGGVTRLTRRQRRIAKATRRALRALAVVQKKRKKRAEKDAKLRAKLEQQEAARRELIAFFKSLSEDEKALLRERAYVHALKRAEKLAKKGKDLTDAQIDAITDEALAKELRRYKARKGVAERLGGAGSNQSP